LGFSVSDCPIKTKLPPTTEAARLVHCTVVFVHRSLLESSGFFNSPNVVVFSATFGFLLRKLILWYQLSSTSYNQLTSLNVNSCQKLKYISCGFNKLTNLDLTNLTQLKIIECNDNHLTKFDYSSLKNSEKLTYLNIKHLVNDIYNKFTGSLEPLKDLKQLKDLHI
ncbi:23039_t:CDS:2, partial [Entrophospora sp. SA101]